MFIPWMGINIFLLPDVKIMLINTMSYGKFNQRIA